MAFSVAEQPYSALSTLSLATVWTALLARTLGVAVGIPAEPGGLADLVEGASPAAATTTIQPALFVHTLSDAPLRGHALAIGGAVIAWRAATTGSTTAIRPTQLAFAVGLASGHIHALTRETAADTRRA